MFKCMFDLSPLLLFNLGTLFIIYVILVYVGDLDEL